MPVRPFSRDQGWLLPPSLDDLLPSHHPARFVAAFVDELEPATWTEMAIAEQGEPLGAPAYHPRALLSVWLYGFMTGARSARKLEAACQEQLPYLWLTGCQRPDHNTLWRFYKANRQGMRALLQRTVHTSLKLGLVDLALQAVDGTKVAGNASRTRTLDAKGLAKVLERTEKAIAALEAQNCAQGQAVVPALPKQLGERQALRERVRAAMAIVGAAGGPPQVNLTDRDATLHKGRQGFVAGYNAQAVASPLEATAVGVTGQLITAAEVTNAADDHGQLLPLLEAAAVQVGERVGVSLADGGYYSGENLAACAQRGYRVLMREAQQKVASQPYHQSRFVYDPQSDSFLCPRGQRLGFMGLRRHRDRPGAPGRAYRGEAGVCRACPAFGECTRNRRHGRTLEIGPHEGLQVRHRALMQTEEAKALYRRRQGLVEPVFGQLKEQQGVRRFLLRGLAGVRAEWSLLATTFNLRSLWRVWRLWPPGCWTGLAARAT